MNGVPRLALEIREACQVIGCSWDWWHEHVAGEVRVVRRGRKTLVPVTELQAWLDQNATRALDDTGNTS